MKKNLIQTLLAVSKMKNGEFLLRVERKKFKPWLLMVIGAISYFSPLFLYAQCGVNAMFTTSSFLGNVPKTVNFTSTSTGNPSTYIWKINNTVVGSNTNILTHTFNTEGIYSVCLTVGNGVCTSNYCYSVPIGVGAGCDDSCVKIPNYDFETIFNPALPGSIQSSNNFNSDVCGWYQQTSTPYYCYYSSNAYIAIRLDYFDTEVAATNIPMKDMINGATYEICWKYSVQQMSFGSSTVVKGPLSINISRTNGSSSNIIRSIPTPPVDVPSANGVFLKPGDSDCYSPEQIHWNKDCFTFTYNSSYPYISISGINQPLLGYNSIQYLLVDYLVISCPPPCGLQPIFVTSNNGCNSTFTLVNGTPSSGNIKWDYGDGFTGTTSTHTYKYPGVFNVCATLTCDDGTSATYCKEVTITAEECATSCTTLSAVSAVKYCAGATSYLGTVKVQVPKGFKPCGSNPTLNSSNTNTPISTNSYNVTSVNASSDEVAISFSINPNTLSSFPATSTSFGFSLCDKYNNQLCFIVPVNATQCNSCLEENLTATCNQNLSTPGNYVYSGTLPSGISGNVVSTSAGFSSSGNTFQILSNTPLPQSTLTTIAYSGTPGNYLCTKYIITVTPCPPPPSNCVATWKAKTFFCTEDSKSSGNPVFNLPNMSVPLTHNGVTYSLCNSTLGGTIEGGGSVGVNSASQTGGNLNFDLSISMPSGTYNGQVFEMRLFLCDPSGNLVCFLFNLVFFCESEGGPRSSKIQIGKEELSVYPNPSSNFVTFDLGNDQNYISEIKIYDQVGKEVATESHYSSLFTLDVQSFPTGLYIASVKDSSGKNKKVKLIVSH